MSSCHTVISHHIQYLNQKPWLSKKVQLDHSHSRSRVTLKRGIFKAKQAVEKHLYFLHMINTLITTDGFSLNDFYAHFNRNHRETHTASIVLKHSSSMCLKHSQPLLQRSLSDWSWNTSRAAYHQHWTHTGLPHIQYIRMNAA